MLKSSFLLSSRFVNIPLWCMFFYHVKSLKVRKPTENTKRFPHKCQFPYATEGKAFFSSNFFPIITEHMSKCQSFICTRGWSVALKSTFILIGPRYFRREILEKERVIWVTVIARAPNWQQICGSCEESNEKRCSSRQKGENKSRLMICPDKGLWKLDGQMSNPLLLGGSTTSSIDTRRPLVRCALLAAAAMSKRLQKRLTRLSISPSKRLLSKVDRKGAWEVATKLFFFSNTQYKIHMQVKLWIFWWDGVYELFPSWISIRFAFEKKNQL